MSWNFLENSQGSSYQEEAQRQNPRTRNAINELHDPEAGPLVLFVAPFSHSQKGHEQATFELLVDLKS